MTMPARTRRESIALTLALFTAMWTPLGCGSSHQDGVDGGATADGGGDGGAGDGAVRLDGATDSGPDAGRTRTCGDGRLDPGEACDDSNLAPGDGCSSTCRRESFCGDGMTDADRGEACDDGNQRSRDGCRGDCASDESCSNGVIDVAVGEVCDDGNESSGDGCSANCRSAELCGNGTVDTASGEQCDDADVDRWDGCGADCRNDQAAVMSTLAIAAANQGCDVTGDGEPDNSFGAALGFASTFVSEFIARGFTEGDRRLVLALLGLESPSAADDSTVQAAWLGATDGDSNPMNDFTGDGSFLVDSASLDMGGQAATILNGALRMARFDGGPETVNLPIEAFPLEVARAHVAATARFDSAGRLATLEGGMICGVMPIAALATAPNPFGAILGGNAPPPCDGADQATVLDILAGGITVFGLMIGPGELDGDLDGDGLESLEVSRTGAPGCQPIVTACIDGDGTRIEGRNCAIDPRIADGYSIGLTFEAVGARLVGVAR